MLTWRCLVVCRTFFFHWLIIVVNTLFNLTSALWECIFFQNSKPSFQYSVYPDQLASDKCWLVFVALRPKSTAMVIAGRSVHLTTLFPGQA